MPIAFPNRFAAVSCRCSLVAVLALWVFGGGALARRARAADPNSITGVYSGSYAGEQGPVKFKLSVTQKDDGILAGVFTLYLAKDGGGKAYTCDLAGYVFANGTFILNGAKWETPPPGGFEMKAGLNGRFDSAGGGGAGGISGSMRDEPRPKFRAVRDVSDPGKVAGATAGEKGAGAAAAAAPVAALAGSPTNAGGGGRVAPAAGRRSVEGVYNGSFDGTGGPMKFKLTITQQDATSVAGVLTFYLPEGSATNAYTCEVKGFYIPAHGTQPDRIQLARSKWETPPPARLLYEGGLEGVFDAGGNNGVGQISGMMGGTHAKFQAVRDAAESTEVAGARLPNNLRPDIQGVFNGTYTRDNGAATKFKLTMLHTPDVIAGVATIYLPGDSGTKAYTYSLSGVETGAGNFQLHAVDWETAPPKDFTDLKGMGFNGRFAPDMTRNTARLVSVEESGPNAALFVPKFEATWDAKESADVKGAIAAQKSVDAADLAAAMKSRAETIRNAKPKRLASADLVRKSKAYWDGYETDMIREVFDGGFGAAIDEDQVFQTLFCTYVETFSSKYAAFLPAKHETVTITRYVTKPDGNGGFTKVPDRTFAVEVDSRFVPKYREFTQALASPGNGLRAFVAGVRGGGGGAGVVNGLLAPARDVDKFFAAHAGNSVAMRQLTENFLRGATGAPSLQQAGEKLDGAGAESDKDLPAGRYARFVDGANAYFRERAEAHPAQFGHSSSHDTALCQHMAELCQSDMTREEEYYYANDFGGRFLPIMGPRALCADPAWPTLHADVEKAVAEVK